MCLNVSSLLLLIQLVFKFVQNRKILFLPRKDGFDDLERVDSDFDKARRAADGFDVQQVGNCGFHIGIQ